MCLRFPNVLLATGTIFICYFVFAMGRSVHNDRMEAESILQQRPCPCNKTEYCKRIMTTPNKEVFVFSVNKQNWRKYDWTKMTTIVEFGYHDDDLLCYAHKRGVRVLFNSNIEVSDLTNHTARRVWVEKQVDEVRKRFSDGVNIDFESAIPEDRNDLRHGLLAYVTDLKLAFECHVPGALVTVDVAWSSIGIDQRFYGYKQIANVSDLFFVMAYDERSQIYDDCIAWANSAYNNTLYGVTSYLYVGVPASKLILGVPWYGYQYPCKRYDPDSRRCTLERVPFRNVSCSDAAGTEITYDVIVKKYLPQSFTGRLWDGTAQSPYFSWKEAGRGQVFQFWYDDVSSLEAKYRLVSELSLRGVGMWTADSLDYSDPGMIRRMWHAIPAPQ